jgi:hypothetical protein
MRAKRPFVHPAAKGDAEFFRCNLEDHGWIERLEPGTVIDGKGRKEVWRLVP